MRCWFVLVALLVARAATARDYMPLPSGMSATYRVTSGGREHTVSVTIKTFLPISGGKLALFRDDKGYATHTRKDAAGFSILALESPGGSEPLLLSPPNYWLRSPYTEGTTWEALEYPISLSGKKALSAPCVIESLTDTITVPFGRFRDALRVRCAASASLADSCGREIEYHIETFRWFVPDVGLVRMQSIHQSSEETCCERSITVELVDQSR